MDVGGRHEDRARADSRNDTSGSAEPNGRGRARRFTKRVVDVVVSGLALVLTMPILLMAALAIRLDSAGPVICRHARVGKDGVPFELFKLRSTVVDGDEVRSRSEGLDDSSAPSFEASAGPRLTRVGRFLRWASIDELPPLWNVLRGEMSLVGPGPALASEAENASSDVAPASLRVLPGVTGTWRDSDSPKAG